MRRLILIGLIAAIIPACSEPKTRPETADKMKPMLVLVNPPAGADVPLEPLDGRHWQTPLAGQEVALQFHFVGPEGMNLTLTPGEPEPAPLTLPITDWTVDPQEAHDYPGLRHVTFMARTQIPDADALASASTTFGTDGFMRLRYTLVVSDGSRDLPLAGDFVVYKDASIAGAQDTLFGSRIEFPLQDEPVGSHKLTIVTSLKNTQDEPVKIGWYVSAGEIKNRRASETEWELPGSGEFTLIFTVRGKESRNGDIQIRRVTLP